MKLDEVVATVANSTGMKRGEVKKVAEALFVAIKSSVAGGQKVSIPGLGVFLMKERAAGERVNPKTGEKKMVAAARYAAFKPARSEMGKEKKKGSAEQKPKRAKKGKG
jgi:DNA-binding protein HU-beta